MAQSLLTRILAALVPVVRDVGGGMADPAALRPGELIRLLNSTPAGAVLTDRRLRAHRARGGTRLGDGRTVHLLRYVAWLAAERRAAAAAVSRETPPSAAAPYERKKERERLRNATASALGRDIAAELDAAQAQVDGARRAAALASLETFLTTYFPATFYRPFSADHRTVLAEIEASLRGGDDFVPFVMPRGFGKTQICRGAALFGLLAGLRRFVLLVAASSELAAHALAAIRMELETNDLLGRDFPEACLPIRLLRGVNAKANSQLYRGQRTYLDLKGRHLVLPAIPGAITSGAVLKAAGLLAAFRGLDFKRPDGQAARPDFVVLDDPQTDASARSKRQCDQREGTLTKGLLGLAAAGRRIAGVMPCTVITPDDLAARALDRERHPAWRGRHFKLIYDYPTNTKRWDEYGDRLLASLRNNGHGEEATAYYRQHRRAMDAGARVAWEACYDPAHEASAVEYAMRRKLLTPAVHAAEDQGTPIDAVAQDRVELNERGLVAQCVGVARGVVPRAMTCVTGFVDVQQDVLFWLVCAWQPDFTGHVVDYGAWPGQTRTYFTLRDLAPTLRELYPGTGVEGSTLMGLDALARELLGRRWIREDAAELQLQKLAVDCNWPKTAEQIKDYIRRADHRGVLLPAHGRYFGRAKTPLAEWRHKDGDEVGLAWKIPALEGAARVRHVTFDTNHWKSFVADRLQTAPGDRGALTLFGAAGDHRLLCEHLVAEYGETWRGRERSVVEWSLRPGRDNHWWDCLVGAAVCASILKCDFTAGVAGPPAAPKPRIKLSELWEQKRWQ